LRNAFITSASVPITFAGSVKLWWCFAAWLGKIGHASRALSHTVITWSKAMSRVFVHVGRGVVADVDAVLLHHRDGTRVHAMRLHAGAEDLRASAGEVLEIAMGDLAAATVAGAKDEDAHGSTASIAFGRFTKSE
jgi:hypothetical protein